MKTNTRLLGAWQIIAGILSLVTLWSITSARGSAALATLVFFSGLAIVAGMSMWREAAHCWRLTIINQLVQVVGFYSPWLAFKVIHGASLTVASHVFAKATFADSLFSHTASYSIGASVCDVSLGAIFGGAPTYGVSLNLLALGILIYAVVVSNKARRSPEPAPTSRGDPAQTPARI